MQLFDFLNNIHIYLKINIKKMNFLLKQFIILVKILYYFTLKL